MFDSDGAVFMNAMLRLFEDDRGLMGWSFTREEGDSSRGLLYPDFYVYSGDVTDRCRATVRSDDDLRMLVRCLHEASLDMKDDEVWTWGGVVLYCSRRGDSDTGFLRDMPSTPLITNLINLIEEKK